MYKDLLFYIYIIRVYIVFKMMLEIMFVSLDPN